MRLTVVIPCYNELNTIEEIVSAVSGSPYKEKEIIIVDDNSPDGTGELAEKLAQQHPGRIDVLHRTAKEGLGRAYLHGFEVPLVAEVVRLQVPR